MVAKREMLRLGRIEEILLDGMTADILYRGLQIISFDEKTGVMKAILEPDPRRYEWRVIKGERYLYDKFDNISFLWNNLAKSIEQSPELPVYYQPAMIDDAEAYIKSRRPLISSMLGGYDRPGTFEDKSEKFLESLREDYLTVLFLPSKTPSPMITLH